MKKAVVCALLAAMLVGNTASVKAADLREIFDAKYYAEQYPDLKQAFGDDEEALYQHFLTYGLKEGRNMNPVLNVQAYRAKYADLDAAFGDNWEAYVQHFFTYGIQEKRDNGTDFDINAYLENYADLKEAFGTDYMAAAKHYMTYGIHENRQEASKEFVWAREEAGKTADEDQSDETEKDDDKDNSDEAGKDDDKDNSDETGKSDFVIDLGSINTFGVNTDYRTAEQIISYLSSSNAKIENDTNAAGYDLSAPYAAGMVSEEDLQEALDMLNQVRYIAGLDTDVTLNSEYTKKIQTGVLINAINDKMDHKPTQPEGMSEEMYKLGYTGTSSSNLAWGSYKMTLSESILGWLDDSDEYNIDRLGHRRWVLNPSMKQTGFGYIYDSNIGTYSGMYAFDGAFGETDKNGVAWPAREMPMQYFENSIAWSYSYGQDLGDVTVKLQCLNTDKAKEWNFSSDASDGFFNVENSYYGQTGCVIFRPEGIDIEAGDVYLVTITNNGSELANYTVRFFE